MPDCPPVTPLNPEEIGVFIQDEKLCGNPRGQHPLPLSHDGFRRANDADDAVPAGGEFFDQAGASFRTRIVGYAEDLSGESLGSTGEAGDKIEFHLVADCFAKSWNQGFYEMTAAAFDQKYAVKRRDPACEKSFHTPQL